MVLDSQVCCVVAQVATQHAMEDAEHVLDL